MKLLEKDDRKMRHDASELIERSAYVLENAVFGSICRTSAEDYRRISDRLIVERSAAGSSWAGPTAGTESRNTSAVRRAAWCRRTHHEVASALDDLRQRRVAPEAAIDRLALWVPAAEECPPLPRGDVTALRGKPGPKHRTVRSKKAGLRELPSNWMQQIWQAAADANHRHLDGLAILLVTGCRPVEASWGVAVRRVAEGVEVSVVGAKTREGAGQAWRRLAVADDRDSPASHLLRLADAAPDGVAWVSSGCSPAAISMAVAALGRSVGLPRVISAYDIRHQRCADARISFGGDVEMVAAWLGHSGTETARHYGRLHGGGCRGARPVSVVSAAPVVRRVRSGQAIEIDDPQARAV